MEDRIDSSKVPLDPQHINRLTDEMLDQLDLNNLNIHPNLLPHQHAPLQPAVTNADWDHHDPNFSFIDALHSDFGFGGDTSVDHRQPVTSTAERGPLDAIDYGSEDAEGEIDEDYGAYEDDDVSEYEDDGEAEEDEWDSNDDGFDASDAGESDVSDEDHQPGKSTGETAIGNDLATFHKSLQASVSSGGLGRLGKRGRKGGQQGKGRRAVQDLDLSPEVQILLGQANQHFASGEWAETLKACRRIIQIEASVYYAWKVMGEVYLAINEPRKCLLAWVSAAHLRTRESELWLTCARMSLELDPVEGADEEKVKDEAVYLYGQAIKANPKDWGSIFERGNLLQEMGRYGKASLDFKKLLDKALPHDTTTVKSLTQCYLGMGRVDDAISTFESHLPHWVKIRGKEGGLDWKHINMLSDLCSLGSRWSQGIKHIRQLSRLLLGRQNETFWDEVKTDCEWDDTDERRILVPGYHPGIRRAPQYYYLPPELRFKLGKFRMKLEQYDEGLHHFELLKQEDVEQIGDLLLEAGDVCVALKKHDEAIGLWFPLTEIPTFQNAELWLRMGKSYKILRNWENARACLECVAQSNEDDIEGRLLLVEVYERLDLNDEALETLNEVMELRQNKTVENAVSRESKGVTRSGLFVAPTKPTKSRQRSKKYNPTISERYQAEKHRTEVCMQNYQKLELLRAQVEQKDPEAIVAWLDTAGEMFDDFRSSRALYPSERRFEYVGFLGYTTARRTGKGSLENQMNLMKRRLESNLEYQLDLESKNQDQEQPDITQYRGLGFDIWLNIILNYAILLTLYEEGGETEAYEVCRAAKDANVFYHDKSDPDPDKRPSFLISLVHLACAVHAQDADQTSECVRWFTTHRLFHDNAYNLYSTAGSFVRGHLKAYPGMNLFSIQNNQKYLMRQLKALDKYVLGKNIVGVCAQLLKDDNGEEIFPTTLSITGLVLYAQIMFDGRSYSSSLHYLARAYRAEENHPMILFQIALSYIHKAMQRQSENRQQHILQGLVFLWRYYEIKKASEDWFDRQEAEYNMARAFHQLGLEHYAIEFYERVISMSDEWKNPGETEDGRAKEEAKLESGDLKWEAAYNLQIMYHTVGSGELCRPITEKNMVI